ncbi:MAG: hypothetical protein IIU46_09270, partial [Treponema sp.]|nr:hypothetical protein [Treponema sp.]
KANGAQQSISTTYPNYGGYWWLRSPYYSVKTKAMDVSFKGAAGDAQTVDSKYVGVVPALYVKLN